MKIINDNNIYNNENIIQIPKKNTIVKNISLTKSAKKCFRVCSKLDWQSFNKRNFSCWQKIEIQWHVSHSHEQYCHNIYSQIL